MEERDREEKQNPTDSRWLVREQLTNSIREKLSQLPPSHSTICIYTVPERLRKANLDAFTPRLVSIGPLHHSKHQATEENKSAYKPHLLAMEEYKLRYVKSFFDREPDILPIIDFIVRDEANLRRYYQDKIDLKSKEFSELILVDSIFIVELLLKNSSNGSRTEENDEIFCKTWMRHDLLHDMILIENQIPLSIPLAIYTHFLSPSENGNMQFCDLLFTYLKLVAYLSNSSKQGIFSTFESKSPRHVVEYLRMALVPEEERESWTFYSSKCRRAKELQEAGVKFVVNRTKRLVEIDFNDKDGTLMIPRLYVHQLTETFFRNIIAFEQCERMSPRYISDYIIFMDLLIDTANDVKVLKESGIIVMHDHGIDDYNEVATLFNNLSKEIAVDKGNYCFGKVSKQLNEYSRGCWRRFRRKCFKWNVMLKNNYFNSPWSILKLVAALTLLVLTIVQTTCSLISLR